MKNSFVELNARERALALLDQGSARELLDPFVGIMSPHLLPQGIVPQSDDGVVLTKGTFNGHDMMIISIEGDFQGGGIGEVSGAKITAALEYTLQDNQQGKKIYPVIIFDTGGVRLQEANYGLLSISEIQNMIVALRDFVPVIGLVPGLVGSFGGMSITSALMSWLMGTTLARVGLNGPEVIEQEAGVREFDSSDKALIWDTIGIQQKAKTGIVDEVVDDNIATIRTHLHNAMMMNASELRSRRMDFFLSLFETIDFSAPITPETYAARYHAHTTAPFIVETATTGSGPQSAGRGYQWFSALTGIKNPISSIPSVLCADVTRQGKTVRYLAVVPDQNNRFCRARNGEIGLQEGFVLAKHIWQAIDADRAQQEKRPLILVIDVPSQAYGYKEELMGIHVALAASVDAYATARQLGHPVIGLIVGNAISGAFLAHGLQSSRLIALDDPAINVQAMSKASAARITLRTVEELEKATEKIPAMAYDIQNFEKLGAIYQLMSGINADQPTDEDLSRMHAVLEQTIAQWGEDRMFEYRYTSEQAKTCGRIATRQVRAQLRKEWNVPES